MLFILFFIKKILSNNNASDLLDSDIYENRLFILSSTTLIFCYFVFTNWIYREIFFLGLIPWIIKNNNNSNNNLPSLLLVLLCLKFILTTLIVYIDLNNLFPNFEPKLRFIKHSVDFFTLSPILTIIIFSMLNFFKKNTYS